MTISEKQNLINKFEKLSNSFDDILSMSDEIILYKPNKDTWSIKEHIVHCLDVDIANFHRYRKAIAEPESNIISFSRVWTSRLNYQSADLKLTIELMKLIRKYMTNHLKTIISENWKNYAYIHDKSGRIDLEEALKSYIEHACIHKKSIDRNINLYNK